MIVFFKKKKVKKLYLGEIYVVHRQDVKSKVDQWGLFGEEKLDHALFLKLQEIFDLPLASSMSEPDDNDMAIDILVPRFQSGAAFFVSFHGGGIPLFWRPKVQVVARLYKVKNNKTLHQVKVLSKLPWKVFASKVFSIKGLSPLHATFDADDLEHLLMQSCLKAVIKLSDKVR
ncbi:hypothetical protein [Endozoicomonas sp. Mp262]|uniref:hypothetical protein n=1 Tax=Endozoicomonas sp. Mp262 TaxID=2919499 RepID=UPI0021D9B0C4